MVRRWAWLAVALVSIAPSKVSAQDEPGAPRIDPTITTTPTRSLPPPEDDVFAAPALPEKPPRAPEYDDAAWRLYHLAFRALASGRGKEAREMLEHITITHARHPAAIRARDLLDRLNRGETAPIASEPGALESLRDGAPTGLARAELAVLQTIHGIVVGAEVCALAECDDPRALGALLIFGGGLGLGASLLATTDGITPGHTAALNTGTIWGGYSGVMLAGAAEADDAQVVLGMALAGQMIGLGTGELLWRLTRPSAGDVSLASSVGIWSTVLTAFAFGAAEFDSDEQIIFGTVLATGQLGLIGGAFLADYVPMSRGRVLVIDGGGIVGGLMGMGVDLLIQGDRTEAAPFFGLAAAGTLAGLGLAAYLTRNWDVPDLELTTAAIPLDGGGMLVVGGTW